MTHSDAGLRKEIQDFLAAELEAAQQLQAVSTRLIAEDDAAALYECILDAAVVLMRSQYASIQMLYPERGELRLLGFRGFNPEAAQFWEWVRPASESTCGMALRTSERCIVADVRECDFMAGTEDLATYLQTGILAVQTTPLLSRTGTLIGMISTHWREPHAPSERELRLFDVLARQAADAIERAQARAALRDAQEALRESDRRKDEFIAVLSHELRNPLAPIRTAVQLLHEADEDPKIRELARGILQRQVSHAIRLVDDLLDLSRITQGTIALCKRDLALSEVLESAVETSRPHIEGASHALEIKPPREPLMVHADPVRLAQVVSNLLNNAARYTPPGGRIELEARNEGGTAVISVRDNGRGIAADMQGRIFEVFFQGGPRSSNGLGIGLWLSRKLIEMHGGTIVARSGGEGLGAEFVVRLPAIAAAAQAAAPKSVAALGALRRRVLVVDDNQDAAESLGLLLRTMGHEVRIAHDGRGALEAVTLAPPEVVLLDLSMPLVDGFAVAQALRNDRRFERVRLVALTGFGQERDRARVREAGFDGHLVKPVDAEALRGMLESRS